MTKHCASGKVRHSSARIAEVAAHAFARELNREHKLAATMYAYKCDDCRGWHLTRLAAWHGEPLTLVFTAPPEELQRWAMGEDQET